MRKEPQMPTELTFGPSEEPSEMCCLLSSQRPKGEVATPCYSCTLVMPHTTQEIPMGMYGEAPSQEARDTRLGLQLVVVHVKKSLKQRWQ